MPLTHTDTFKSFLSNPLPIDSFSSIFDQHSRHFRLTLDFKLYVLKQKKIPTIENDQLRNFLPKEQKENLKKIHPKCPISISPINVTSHHLI